MCCCKSLWRVSWKWLTAAARNGSHDVDVRLNSYCINHVNPAGISNTNNVCLQVVISQTVESSRSHRRPQHNSSIIWLHKEIYPRPLKTTLLFKYLYDQDSENWTNMHAYNCMTDHIVNCTAIKYKEDIHTFLCSHHSVYDHWSHHLRCDLPSVFVCFFLLYFMIKTDCYLALCD